jgi:hypothetical protein
MSLKVQRKGQDRTRTIETRGVHRRQRVAIILPTAIASKYHSPTTISSSIIIMSSLILRNVSTNIHAQLVTAIHQGNMENIRMILSQKEQNGLTDDEIWKAISAICGSGRILSTCLERANHDPLQVCKMLYDSISSESKKESQRHSPLHEAAGAFGPGMDIVQWLVLELGHNVNIDDGMGVQPLTCAAGGFLKETPCEAQDICMFLLENGAIPNPADNFKGVLYLAVRGGNMPLIRLLLDKYEIPPGKNSVNHAIYFKKPNVLALLLQNGGRVVYRPPPVEEEEEDDDENEEDDDISDIHGYYYNDENAYYYDDDYYFDACNNVDEDGEDDHGSIVSNAVDEVVSVDEDDDDMIYQHSRGCTTVLNERFENDDNDGMPRIVMRRYAHLNICRILVNHANKKTNNEYDDTTALLLASLVIEPDKARFQDFFNAGMDKNLALHYAVESIKDFGIRFKNARKLEYFAILFKLLEGTQSSFFQ